MITKELLAAGLAEKAWGQIVHWQRAGKVQGNLTYEEVRDSFEPLFLEALEAGPDLKRVLMELGNELVTEHKFDPSGPLSEITRVGLASDYSTMPVTIFTEWLNQHPPAREVLAKRGLAWSMPEKKGSPS